MGAVTNLVDAGGEALQTLKKEVLHVGGKKVVAAAPGLGGGAAAGTGSVFSVLGVGAAAAVSAVIQQIEYRHKRDRVRAFYREEIAAKLGKPIRQVSDSDLDALEKGNPRGNVAPNHTVGEHLAQKRRERNYGVFTSAVSMLATIMLVGAITISSGVPAAFLLKTLIGIACFQLVREPLEWIGKKFLGIGRETTHDKIVALSKDHKHCKAVSREQVLGVFVSANKGLQEFVEANYGESYDRLDRYAKQHAADALEQFLPLTEITRHISDGTVRPNELAFAVQGEISGVLPRRERKESGLLGKAGAVLKGLGHKFGIGDAKTHNTKVQAHPAEERPVREVTEEPKPVHAAVEYDNDVSGRSFADKILAERAQAQAVSPTIH